MTQVNANLQFRKTIKHPGVLEGVGLHSGEPVKLLFYPADDGAGINFYRKTGADERHIIPVTLDYVIDTSLAVTVGTDQYHVQTVEHLMYAIFVSGITDLTIEIQGGSEIPILDGSAKDFIETLDSLELHEYPTEAEVIEIDRPVSVTDGERYIVGLPAREYKISYHIDYAHPLLANQSLEIPFKQSFFKEKIGQARTFGFLREVEYLRSKGLARGGTTENVVVYTPEGTLNETRFAAEAIYHKVLDMVGDLALIGRTLRGHILGSRAGHALDVAFGNKIIEKYISQRPRAKSAFSISLNNLVKAS